jgi:TP901 family phage tail tape measure protein
VDGSTTLLYRFLGIDAGAGAQFDRMAGKTAMLGDSSAAALAKVKMLAKGAVLAGVVIGVGSVAMAAHFQSSMLRIQTQANASHAQVERLSKGVLDMAGQVAETPAVLADAAYHIASIGQGSLTTAKELRVLRIATEGAKIGGANLTDVTNALDAAIVSHIRGVKNYSQAMGVLNSTVGAGDMTMQDLADAFGPLGAVMKGYNVDIRQVGAALATFGDNNIRGAAAGTQLRMAVQALAVPSAHGVEILKKWGIESGNLSKQLEHGGLTSALDTLMQKMRANGVTAKDQGNILTQTFGKRAGVGLSVLEGQLGRFHTKLGEVSKGASGFGSSWKTYTKSFGYAWDSAKASAEALMIELGTKLLPIATKLMNWISTTAIPALSRFGSWLKKNAEWTKPLAIALGVLAIALYTGPIGAVIELAIGLVILYKRSATFREIVKDVAVTVISYWKMLARVGVAVFHAIGAVWNWLANGPIAYVRARIADFAAWYHQHAQQIRTVTHAVWSAVSAIVKLNWRIVMDIVRNGLVVLKAVFRVAFVVIRDVVRTSFKVIGDVIKFWLRTFLDLAGIVLDIITGKWGKAWNDAKKLVEDAFNGIKSIFEDFITGAVNLLYDAGRAVVQGLIDGIKSMAGSVLDTVKGVGSSIKGGFKKALSIFSPSRVFYEYGIHIVQGLINGVKTYTVRAREVARQLALGLISGWKDGTSKLKDALTSPVQRALQNMTNIVDTLIGKQQDRLKKAQAALKAILKQRASDIASLAGSIGQGADLSGLFGSDANGNPSVTNVNSFLSGQAAQIKNFAKDLTWAARHHLSPALLSEIAGLGSEQGDQVLKQFMSGGASINSANRSEATIQRFSRSAATSVENAVYAKRVAADRKAVHDNTTELRKLNKALHAIERRTAKAASTHVTIDAKTGRPVVDKQFINDILRGIRRAENIAGKALI